MNTHQSIIDDYKRNYSIFDDTLLKFCKEQKDLNTAIYTATKSIDKENRKHFHQRRIKQSELDLLAIQLAPIQNEFRQARSFDEIFNIVSMQVFEKRYLKGIGPLTIYDVSLRIGYYLNLMPDKIYLQSGSKIGAKKLAVKFKNNTISISELPNSFRQSGLCEADLENLLCIFREHL